MTKPGVVNQSYPMHGLIKEIVYPPETLNDWVSNVDLKAELFFEVKKLQPQNIQ